MWARLQARQTPAFPFRGRNPGVLEKRALFASLRGWLVRRGQLVLLVLLCLGWRRHWLNACCHWLKADLSPFLLGKTGAALKVCLGRPAASGYLLLATGSKPGLAW